MHCKDCDSKLSKAFGSYCTACGAAVNPDAWSNIGKDPSHSSHVPNEKFLLKHTRVLPIVLEQPPLIIDDDHAVLCHSGAIHVHRLMELAETNIKPITSITLRGQLSAGCIPAYAQGHLFFAVKGEIKSFDLLQDRSFDVIKDEVIIPGSPPLVFPFNGGTLIAYAFKNRGLLIRIDRYSKITTESIDLSSDLSDSNTRSPVLAGKFIVFIAPNGGIMVYCTENGKKTEFSLSDGVGAVHSTPSAIGEVVIVRRCDGEFMHLLMHDVAQNRPTCQPVYLGSDTDSSEAERLAPPLCYGSIGPVVCTGPGQFLLCDTAGKPNEEARSLGLKGEYSTARGFIVGSEFATVGSNCIWLFDLDTQKESRVELDLPDCGVQTFQPAYHKGWLLAPFSDRLVMGVPDTEE